MSEIHSKDEIIEIILSAGLLDDLLDFLRSKGIDVDDRRLYDLDENILKEYAEKKRLLKFGDDTYQEHEESYEDLEPTPSRPRTPPRKQ
ncbi:MAG: hypothetical protein QW039_05760 [Fervidicoccaceae archaeon]